MSTGKLTLTVLTIFNHLLFSLFFVSNIIKIIVVSDNMSLSATKVKRC